MLVFAYAHGGKKFDMPKDVGFRAGGSKCALWINDTRCTRYYDSGRFKYVVVQMHYRVVVKVRQKSGS